VVGKVVCLSSVLTCRVGLVGRRVYSLGGALPARAPPARLGSSCSSAARPLRAGALSAQKGGVRPFRRRSRCRQPAAESCPGATLPWVSHRPSEPRHTSSSNRAARPAPRSRGSRYPRPSTRSAQLPVRPRTPRLGRSLSDGRLRGSLWLSHRRPCRPLGAAHAGHRGQRHPCTRSVESVILDPVHTKPYAPRVAPKCPWSHNRQVFVRGGGRRRPSLPSPGGRRSAGAAGRHWRRLLLLPWRRRQGDFAGGGRRRLLLPPSGRQRHVGVAGGRRRQLMLPP